MKKTQLIALLFLIVVSVKAEQKPGKYFFTKSGYIEYTLGGNSTGKKTVWFDNYGMLMNTLTESSTTVSLLGFKNTTKEKKLEIRKGEEIWVVDLIAQTGSRMSIQAQSEIGKELTVNKTENELHQMERKVISDMGGKIEGYETVLGKKCLVFTLGSSKFYQYKGIPLKSEVTLLGVKYNEIVSRFDENINIPASKFVVPENIDFQDAGNLGDVFKNIKDASMSNDEEEEEEVNDIPPGLDYSKFKKATQKLNIPGYRFFMSSPEDNIYLTSYVKSEEDQVIVFAEHESKYNKYVSENDAYVVKARYKYKGKDAAFIQILKEEDGTPVDSRMLLVKYPEHKTLLYILSGKVKTQKELEDIMSQIIL